MYFSRMVECTSVPKRICVTIDAQPPSIRYYIMRLARGVVGTFTIPWSGIRLNPG
jgi:hypothetical protein